MPPERVPEVRVLTSPADVAAARVEGDADQQQLTATLRPDSLEALNRQVTHSELQRFGEERGRVLPLLRDMSAADGAQAAAACIALAWFEDDPAYLHRVQRILAAAIPEALDQCLQLLGRSGDVLREVSGAEVLAPQLREIVAARVGQSRPAALRAAFELGVTIDGPEVVEELVQLGTQSRSLAVDPWIARALGLLARRGGETALPAALALLRPPFARGRDAKRAGRSRDPRILGDLERVWHSDVTKNDKGEVLQAFADVQGPAAVPRLLDALLDQELAFYAATALGIAAEGTGDEAIVVALTLSATGGRNVHAHATAMARIGGPLAMRTLAGLATRVQIFSAIYAGWRARGITAVTAIQRFVDAGVIPKVPSEAAVRAAAESDWAWEPNDVWLWWHFLRRSGRLCEVSPEDGDTSGLARHPLQLRQFAAASGGRVVVEHASQRVGAANARGDEHEVIVQFVWDDRVYRVTAIGFNRNFDTRAMCALLNEALGDRGDAARFVPLQGHDYAHFVFGDERAVQAACDELLIPRGFDRPWHDRWHQTLEAVMLDAGRPA